ncbi:MAG TPA: class I SAM-dependent methyltransferase [Gammaproteobacteria bacterium]
MTTIILKSGREKSLLRKHPWIFSGAIASVSGKAQAGETVEVKTDKGELLGCGAWSPESQIRVRMWSFETQEKIDAQFFYTRLERAIEARKRLRLDEYTTAYRTVNAESDGLPGIVIDRYGEYLVCQFLSTGAEYWKQVIVEQLVQLLPAKGIYERSDVDVRQKEGLQPASGVLMGEAPPDAIEIKEGDCRFYVDIKHGHKTGFYLDQRENRAAVVEFAQGTEVLNCFSYTGGFGIWALKGGANKVTNLDSSAALLEHARRNIELNHLDTTRVENVAGDAFQILRQYRDANRQFDLIILDPPKFAESKDQIKRASRGYKDINLLACKLLKPGGILFTFSCSGLMEGSLFQKIVADAALDAGRNAQMIRWLTQAADHPTALNFPEGSYLKGMICRVW